jgi:hypothetical protein
MTPFGIFSGGIDPDHIPALVGAALVPVLVLALRHRGSCRGWRPAEVSLPTRVFGWLMAISAGVHIGLPFGHHDNTVLTIGFLGSGAGYGYLAWRAGSGRRYRSLSVLLILATLVGYLAVVLSGGEGPDQVGIATALDELAALGLCLIPERAGRLRRALGGTALILVTVLAGAVLWGGALAQHAAGGAGDRAQAGVLVPPGAGHGHEHGDGPTAAQLRAALQLAARTRAALARYADVRTALAAGYHATLGRTGYSVHLRNDAYTKDGRVLDPQRPEELMYAIAAGRATLLSAVYTMPYAAVPAPTPGGPLTHWHSHNICLSLLPPGWSVVDAFGGCPPFSVQVAIPLMMHVWVVDDPGGPYADSVPDAWTRAFNLAHGVPFSW